MRSREAPEPCEMEQGNWHQMPALRRSLSPPEGFPGAVKEEIIQIPLGVEIAVLPTRENSREVLSIFERVYCVSRPQCRARVRRVASIAKSNFWGMAALANKHIVGRFRRPACGGTQSDPDHRGRQK